MNIAKRLCWAFLLFDFPDYIFLVPAEENESKSPRTRTQTPIFSAAPRDNNESGRNDRISMATPSTADLYSVMNLRTKTEHLAEEYVKLINFRSALHCGFNGISDVQFTHSGARDLRKTTVRCRMANNNIFAIFNIRDVTKTTMQRAPRVV